MKTQKELIEYYSKRLEKVISSYGLDSDYTTHAFYLLQAIRIGVKEYESFSWANKKCEELRKEALSLI